MVVKLGSRRKEPDVLGENVWRSYLLYLPFSVITRNGLLASCPVIAAEKCRGFLAPIRNQNDADLLELAWSGKTLSPVALPSALNYSPVFSSSSPVHAFPGTHYLPLGPREWLSIHRFKLIEIVFLLASPKVILLDPSPVVSALPGFELSCIGIPGYYPYLSPEDIAGYRHPQHPVYAPVPTDYVPGAYPIHTAMIFFSSLLVNETGMASIRLYKEGNYSCVATNKYGAAVKKFTVIFTGKTLLCGENFISCYYSCAPRATEAFARSPWVRKFGNHRYQKFWSWLAE